MYIHLNRHNPKKRGKSNRYKAKIKAAQRRRVNRMAGRKLGRRRKYNG
ncbi:MAG: hypothetical protein GXY23_11640 [Myxococcales bacterium]|nr:hypothetical protein [Myxococcales bacterium]